MMSAIPLEDIVVALSQLHPPLSNLAPTIFDFKFKHIFISDKAMFTQALAIAPHLSLKGLSGMVYEHLSRCFIPKDPSSRFSKLLQSIIIVAHIPRSMALMLGVNRLLVMI